MKLKSKNTKKYPYVGLAEGYDIFVFFTGRNKGILLQSPFDNCYKPGDVLNEWIEDDFFKVDLTKLSKFYP